ncbi:bifunctional pyr operon transcriptional regulator/uracil phosphoribosyltransferase PyrR [Thermithiobacillus plumbiphilus]|uniref:Bifunctional pyr operon transcriptional regulator/uracil phosphoribosyltransferase PyrR n=1 Tax=Thermithiobacillus plumbiphilus TaxID=1729899 RepID=A0ABU9DBE4_9PROT
MRDDIEAVLDQMAEKLRSRLPDDAAIIGIYTGGVWVAEALQRRLDLETEAGQVDISFYRDDFTRIGLHPQVRASHIPFDVDNRHILLVDDVLHTGRTIRAALNEIFDYGRPAQITLAVLVDRDGRELPIQADVVGMYQPLQSGEQIKLTGPEPLRLEIRQQQGADSPA